MRIAGCCALLLTITAATVLAEEFYVAPDGTDADPGTLSQPFATLARARDAVRQSKDKGKTPINVILRGGTYFLTEPVLLGPEDSGTAECPITYTAYPGEKPVLSGGRLIAGWKKDPQGFWTAEIPDVRDGKWYFRQLHINGRRCRRARLPAEGVYHVAGVPEASNSAGWGVTVKGDKIADAPQLSPQRAFKFLPGEIDPNWRNRDDVEIVLLQYWGEARMRIKTVDPSTNIVEFTGEAWRPTDWSNGWWVENVFEGLAQPGTWYLDRAAGLLYYHPLPDEKIEQFDAVAPVATQWLRLEGDFKASKYVEHLAFRGLTFADSSWQLDKTLGYSYPQASVEHNPGNGDQAMTPVPSAVLARAARHISFEENEFARTGAWAVHFAQGGCKQNRIVRNTFRDIGAGAIRIGGINGTNDDAEESGDTTITDNRIENCAQVYLGAPAVWIGQSSGNLFSHNDVSGDCEWGVSVGWTWGYLPPGNARDNVIEYNHFHNMGGSPLGIHGAIYLLGVQPGTVVRHNLVHDIAGSGSGIVLDQSSTGILVENNVVHHVAFDGLLFNFNDQANIIQNNIVAFADRSLVNRSGDAGKIDPTGIFYRNIFYLSGEKAVLYTPDKWPNYDMVIDCNLYYSPDKKPLEFLEFDFDQWKAKGLDGNSIVADPLFADPEKGDFRLAPNSPAFQLGFRSIDLSQVGIQPRQP